jgi:putative PIN family toxin of toxin-antitoxin system
MRIVLDPNVLVSAALRDRDPEAVIQYIVRTPGVEWIATPPIVTEYQSVLRRPRFGLTPAQLDEWDRLISAAILVVDSVPAVPWEADPGDAVFVACAIGVKADFLISGDQGLLGAGKLGATLVVTVSQFKQLVCDGGS